MKRINKLVEMVSVYRAIFFFIDPLLKSVYNNQLYFKMIRMFMLLLNELL